MTAITLTASEARANLYRLMDQAAESHQPEPTGSGLAFCPQADNLTRWQDLFALSVPARLIT